MVGKFYSVHKLGVVAKYVRAQLGNKKRFTIATTFPRRLFSSEVLKSKTLLEVGTQIVA